MASDQQSTPRGPVTRGRGQAGTPPPSDTQGIAEDARDIGREAKERVRERLDDGRHAAASQAEAVSDAIADAADRLGAENPSLAEHAQRLSDGIARFADGLRHRSLDDLAGEAQAMARRNPTMFLLGSIAVGVAASRFLKASSHRQREEPRELYAGTPDESARAASTASGVSGASGASDDGVFAPGEGNVASGERGYRGTTGTTTSGDGPTATRES